MFGLHSWSAMRFAPVVGAILGFAFALASLRRYGLAFGTTLEEYRGAAKVQSLADSYPLYKEIAFGIAAVVSIVELPFILIGQAPALYILVAGSIVIFGYTLYRAWQIGDASLFGNLDVIQIVGGAALLTILGTLLYAPMQAGMPIQSVPAFDMVEIILVLNAVVAMGAIVVAIFGLNLLYRFLDLINKQLR